MISSITKNVQTMEDYVIQKPIASKLLYECKRKFKYTFKKGASVFRSVCSVRAFGPVCSVQCVQLERLGPVCSVQCVQFEHLEPVGSVQCVQLERLEPVCSVQCVQLECLEPVCSVRALEPVCSVQCVQLERLGQCVRSVCSIRAFGASVFPFSVFS